MEKKGVLNAIDHFSKLKILVIGDVILDAYYRGKVSRISPEAPVPVIDIESKEFRLGGAANVALNVKHLGAECIVCSVVGQDQPAQFLKEMLTENSIDTSGLIESPQRHTSIKTRLVSGFSQLLRMDEETTTPIDKKEEADLLNRIKSLINDYKPEAIIFEDYDKGVITKSLIDEVVLTAKSQSIPIAVDPKKDHFLDYSGVQLFKPNFKELKEGLNLHHLTTSKSDLEKAFIALNGIMPIEKAFFTLSGDGVFITDGSLSSAFPAIKRNIADVSGAGDTVIATAACALASGLDMASLAFISNIAGGWVCQFPGVVPINASDLKSETEKHFSNGR
ncbi:MAG: PfkB family carbohydrate kinase [Salibacteraceae bacterium]